MPAGMSWPKYLRLITASMGSMLLGSQLVHNIYRPLDDLDEFIVKYREEREKMIENSSKKT